MTLSGARWTEYNTWAFALRAASSAPEAAGKALTQAGFGEHVDCRKSTASTAVEAAVNVTGAGGGTASWLPLSCASARRSGSVKHAAVMARLPRTRCVRLMFPSLYCRSWVELTLCRHRSSVD